MIFPWMAAVAPARGPRSCVCHPTSQVGSGEHTLKRMLTLFGFPALQLQGDMALPERFPRVGRGGLLAALCCLSALLALAGVSERAHKPGGIAVLEEKSWGSLAAAGNGDTATDGGDDDDDDEERGIPTSHPHEVIQRFHDNDVASDILNQARENYKQDKEFAEASAKATGRKVQPVVRAGDVDDEHYRDAYVTGLKQVDKKGGTAKEHDGATAKPEQHKVEKAAKGGSNPGKMLLGQLEKHKVRAPPSFQCSVRRFQS